VPPTPVRLMRRALEGEPTAPSNIFFVITQGPAVTSGRRDQSPPSMSTLCGHPCHCSATPGTMTTSPTLLECAWTRRRHDRHCATYGPPSTVPSNRPATTVRRPTTTPPPLEVAPVRAQDAPRRHDRNEIRQDDRQLHGTTRHASTRRRIVQHACKSPSPWPIKGRAIPQPQGTRREDG
jgi:hypothetical protein